MNEHSASGLLDQGAAAKLLNVSVRTLEGWRLTGKGPQFARLSRRAIRYRLQDLERFIADRIRKSTSDTGTVSPKVGR
jgi:hypothetical protein